MALFPSDEWLARYQDLINGSPEYRESAEDWEGDVAFFIAACRRTWWRGSTCGTGSAAGCG
jgi:hypothetical protein